MPKLEARQIQQEIKEGLLWPVYWIYGSERMKSRELLKRIRRAALGEDPGSSGLGGFAEEMLDGTQVEAVQVLDAVQSLSLGGGLRFVVVRDAHAIKELEQVAPLLGPRAKKEELSGVCVFLSKDLDARKKFSKLLIEKAAVVACEEVPENEREAWIGYLAKGRGLELSPPVVLQLRSLDPWNLDIVDQELEKFSLAGGSSEVLLGDLGPQGGTDAFLAAFLGSRNLKDALPFVESLAANPDQALPLLGLLGWNVRHLALIVSRARGVKLNSFLESRLRGWASRWSWDEILALQNELAELDFSIKQTPRLPLGIWTALVTRFCR